jgi:thiamine-phosphate pyrophosphorylase
MLPRVLQITAASILPEEILLARITAAGALPAEARRRFAVQLRDPEIDTRSLLRLGRILRDATAAIGASLVVNDRLDLARALRADGVHLGHRSVDVADARDFLPGATWIAVACHSIEEVRRAAGAGADAAVLSPIFATPGKGPPIGLDAIREAREAAPAIHLIALGGIDAANARACLDAGAGGVASIRADLVAATCRTAS